MTKFLPALVLICLLSACKQETGVLPYIGFHEFEGADTIYHKIPEFNFLNQDSVLINNDSFNDLIYVADFFFVNCPSICPKVKQQMLRIHDKFKNEPRLQLISYTLDPKRDTIPVLASYAEKIGVKSDKWHFLRSDTEDVMELADEYYVPAFVDPGAPGGFDHSGKLMLIDKDRHIRGFAEGTDPESVTDFFGTIEQLLNEQFDQ